MGLNIGAAAVSLPFICTSNLVFIAALAFVGLALLAAIAHVIVYSIVELRKSRASGPKPAIGPSGFDKILESLKGVLEALAKLPHWVAIFLAGLALLWMAGQRPGICAPPQASPPGQPAGK